MDVSDRKQLSSLYRIEDGIIYYRYFNKEFSREVVPQIVDLLTKKRRVKIGGEYRYMTVLYENELKSINAYIAKHDLTFKLSKPYPKGREVIRAVGSISITNKNKEIR
jgi:hypothetical protein